MILSGTCPTLAATVGMSGQRGGATATKPTDLRNEPLEIEFRIKPRERIEAIVLRMTWKPAAPGKQVDSTRLYDSRTPSMVYRGTRIVPLLRKEVLDQARVLSTWPKNPKPLPLECRERLEFRLTQGSEKRSWNLCIDPESKDARGARARGWVNLTDEAIQRGKTG